VFTLQQPHK